MADPLAALRRSRPRLLAAALAAASLLYVILLLLFEVSVTPRERHFGSTEAEPRRLEVYLEPTAMDAVNDVMQLRISASPGPTLRGRRPAAPNRNITVLVRQGSGLQPIVLRANESMPSASVELDFGKGNIADYPFDRYVGSIRLQTLEGTEADPGTAPALPASVTFWEGLHGYRVRATALAGGLPGDLSLRVEVQRSGAFRYFAVAAFAAMVAIAGVGLAIGSTAFLGGRRPESTLVSALAAMVFALPALRNALPGAPPLGVTADLLVFLWTVLAAVISLVLFVSAWLREAHRP